MSPKNLAPCCGRKMLVEQLVYFTKGMVVKYTLPGSDDVLAPPYMSFKREIVKNGQHTNEQGKIELKHVAALLSVSHGKNVVTVDAYPVNITFSHQGRSSFLKKVHTTKYEMGPCKQQQCWFKKLLLFSRFKEFPFHLRNFLSFSTENK